MKQIPRLRAVTGVIFRAGNLTLGGGPPAFAVIQREFLRRNWFDDADFALCYALARITPGTNMLAFFTACGWLTRRWPGAILGLLASSIPCCTLVWLMTKGFDRISGNPWVQAGVAGALAASVGILIAAFWLLVRGYLTPKTWVRSTAVVAASIALSLFWHLTPVTVLILAAVYGYLEKD